MPNPPSLISFALLLPVLAIIQGCSNQPQSLESHTPLIQDVLETQVAQWNLGDIPAFMETYIKSEALRFSSGGTVQQGWSATLQRYLTRYPNKEAMGRLEFEDLKIKILSETWAEVHGRYQLYRVNDYGNATGLFTLLMENTSDGWKIRHDHTSSESG